MPTTGTVAAAGVSGSLALGAATLGIGAADYAVLSGQVAAVRALQDVLGVTVDGVLGPYTLAALTTSTPRAVNNALVAARVRFMEQIVDKDQTQLKWFHGWVKRAVGFYMVA